MVITEENGNPFTEQSLADQLVAQNSPVEAQKVATDSFSELLPQKGGKSVPPSPEQVQQAMQIE